MGELGDACGTLRDEGLNQTQMRGILKQFGIGINPVSLQISADVPAGVSLQWQWLGGEMPQVEIARDIEAKPGVDRRSHARAA